MAEMIKRLSLILLISLKYQPPYDQFHSLQFPDQVEENSMPKIECGRKRSPEQRVRTAALFLPFHVTEFPPAHQSLKPCIIETGWAVVSFSLKETLRKLTVILAISLCKGLGRMIAAAITLDRETVKVMRQPTFGWGRLDLMFVKSPEGLMTPPGRAVP